MSALLSWPHSWFTALLSALIFVGHLGVAARALTRPNRTPASRVAWVAVITAVPLLGIVAYLLLGETSIGRARERRLREVIAAMPKPSTPTAPKSAMPDRIGEVFDLGTTIDGLGPVAGNHIRLLGDPDASADRPMLDSELAIESLVADIDAATDSVHIAFYIWLDDVSGGKVADAVAAAARRGVSCRVSVDALGSRAFTRSPRWGQLKDAGVHAVVTLNDIPRLGHLPVGRLDLRNHRKIVVIDNTIAYCGSQNCADPQFRVAAKYAPWADIFLRCEGPVVRQLQYIFLTGWLAENPADEAELMALPSAQPGPQVFSDGPVAQMFGTGPTTPGNSMSDMFVATIFAARSDLLITTPYFVPDEALLRALCAAPRRGVRTRIIFPARNNSRLVGDASRSDYAEMLAAGVQIYEYPLGLLHTKSMTVDGEFALVGSANMDRRSLQLNFENNLVVADPTTTAAVRARQETYLSVSHQVLDAKVAAWPFHTRLVQNTVGMLAPLL
ncbi:cardiolipin synthase [Kineosphaera limosa]|uniref:Cardiolipin synthase n=1 Tax=Kineosphaera limosa NBRC 100340 TaxID=1184609 RepID=K6WBF0_9MICO|nr:cardiolipin synthase [Kineosphaera limosa]NYE01234.1 cardiolipin synthase [Kineosphaera limosa]GAB96565.1 cardiolipin synthetase [Kineosphaera limosa NBRC 100340]